MITLIIDPVDKQIERDLSVLREYGLKLAWTVETHAHADSITSAGQLGERAGAEDRGPGRLRHHDGGGPAQGWRFAIVWRRKDQGAAYARPHRREHVLPVA